MPGRRSGDGAIISTRQLNRCILGRQLLLERADIDIPTALHRVAGLQTQYAPSGYVGLWSRLQTFARADLTRALEDRTVVQGTMMRVTIHMVAAGDYWAMTTAVRTSRRQWWERVAAARTLTPIDHRGIARVVRRALRDGPRSAKELIAALESAGYPKALWEGAGLWVDMVRVPPSGTWERRRADLFALSEQWLPPPADVGNERDNLRALMTRYLSAFGPATVADAAAWSGVPRARLERIVSAMELRQYRHEDGSTLLDVDSAPLPAEDAIAPVRFLPTWDATLLVHCRRSQILPETLRAQIFHTKNPSSVGTVLVDGQVAATWSWRDDRVHVDELRPLRRVERRDVDREAEALTVFYRD